MSVRTTDIEVGLSKTGTLDLNSKRNRVASEKLGLKTINVADGITAVWCDETTLNRPVMTLCPRVGRRAIPRVIKGDE